MQVCIERIMAQSEVSFGTSGARGLVKNMTDTVCYAYTEAFMKVTNNNPGKNGCVVLGHDLRPSSPRIASACACAIANSGKDIVYAGALPTPALAWYARKLKATAIAVTGSHIPFDRNGIKFYSIKGEISKTDEQSIRSATINIPERIDGVALPVPDKEAGDCYIDRYVQFFGQNFLSGMRIAVYEHSSVARDILKTILRELGAEVISLGRTDMFVPIDTEAVRQEDVEQASRWAKEYGFDAIVSTDGDADRPLIGDERGHWLRGDIVGILCAHYLGADIVVTPVSCNTAVEKSGLFGRVVRTKVGSPYVIAAMEEQVGMHPGKTVVGYEANGGFLLNSNIELHGKVLHALPTRDAVLPILALFSMARQRGLRISQLQSFLPSRFTASNRLQNFSRENSLHLIEFFRNNISEAQKWLAPSSGRAVAVNETDGFRIVFENRDIVHLRPSGNAPELRCYAESDSPDKAELLCESCLQQMKEFPTFSALSVS